MRKILLLLSVLSTTLYLTAHAARSSARADAPTTNLEINSQPAGATVYIGHRQRGNTPLTLTDLAAGSHLVHIAHDGYRDHYQSVTLELGVPQNITQRLEPLTGLLLILTDPDGCDVAGKGVSLGTTPLLITTLESGAHRLTISAPGYQSKEIDIELEGRTPLKYETTLLSDSGTLYVSSDPEGAHVFINGIARGNTPCRIDRIPGGTVTMKVEADGFITDTREISLAAGEQQNINLRLNPQPGTLRIVATDRAARPLEGARIYIDNQFSGITPFDLVNAEPRDYRVRVEMRNYAPIARNITLVKGGSVTEEFRLQRITGRMEVITAPARATIFIDGKKIGITSTPDTDSLAVSDPYAIEDIAEGKHEIEVIRKGFGRQKKEITVKRDETLTLQFKLDRQFIPDYEVVTTRSHYRGVLEFRNDEGIKMEISPGISQTIPMHEIKRHGPIRDGE